MACDAYIPHTMPSEVLRDCKQMEAANDTKRFNLIAETIRLLPSFIASVYLKPVDSTTIVGDAVRFDALCHRFAEALSTTNPRFNKDRFIAACNGKGGR
jgi:hypothetical protein